MSLRAVILVGGEGTRLRPLTYQTPKPLVPVLAVPLLEHLLRQLAAHDIRDIILAGAARDGPIGAALGDGAALGVQLRYVSEPAPLGSGGAIATVTAGWDAPFLVINGDIITDLDIGQFVALHRRRGAEVSLLLSAVDDPSAYGVVALDAADRITQFVEKPRRAEAPSRWVNGGIWLFARPPLDGAQADRFSRVEDTLFPALAAAGRPIFGVRHCGYWSDVGTLATYHQANLDAACGIGPCARPAAERPGGLLQDGATVEPGAVVTGPALIGPGSLIRSGATLRGPTVIGLGCTVEAGAEIAESVLWDGVTVGADARVVRSVLANGVAVGESAQLRDTVIAPGPQGATEPRWRVLDGERAPEPYRP